MTVLAGGVPEPVSNLIIAWAIVLACIACGALCIYFAAREEKVNGTQVADVVSQMELIERRFPRSGFTEPVVAGGLVIRSAKYGVGNANVDVTAKLKALVDGGRLRVLASNDLGVGGDPCKGRQKTLAVEYSSDGVECRAEVKENDWLGIP